MLNLFKPKRTFESEIKQLKVFGIDDSQKNKVIKLDKRATENDISKLLKIFCKYDNAFSIYDIIYPSPSDPGAYISYSKKYNELENTWSMTLGNHGWTGGIYTIDERIIALQIYNLVSREQINTIQIENVNLFKYDMENIDFNRNQNALIYGIHSNISKIETDYLIFGIFSSDNYNPYYIYKLTKDKLFVDKSGVWNSKRHSKDGYIFKGEELSSTKFEITKELSTQIPLELVTKKWNGFYTTGNKNEDQLILEFQNSKFHRTISINSYELETDMLPIEIGQFRRNIEKIITKIHE
jgi:hypothetical protein